ncbi:MAG: hypothetical protein ISS71_04760 [Phycisphaerae bacterium]|nr:hypothetical protein [Phycisphaerae bacterium]
MPKKIEHNEWVDAFYLILGGSRTVSQEAVRLADLGLIGLYRKTLVQQGLRRFDGRFPVKEDEQFDNASMNDFESRSSFEVVRTAMGVGFIATAAFSEALDQTMLDFYEAAEPNWQRWANACEVSHLVGTRIDYDPAETSDIVAPGKDFGKSSGLNKTTNEINLEKRGRLLGISFEALMAGDVSEIQRLLKEEVAALVRAEDDEMINALTGTAGFFTTKNTVSLPLLTGLEAAMTKLRQMKSGKTKLHYEPKILLIPSILEVQARQQLYEADLKNLEIVVESRLDDMSTINWYLVANKQQSDSVVLQFLNGFRKPELRHLPRKLDFDGERYRIKHVCKAKANRSYSIIKGDA